MVGPPPKKQTQAGQGLLDCPLHCCHHLAAATPTVRPSPNTLSVTSRSTLPHRMLTCCGAVAAFLAVRSTASMPKATLKRLVRFVPLSGEYFDLERDKEHLLIGNETSVRMQVLAAYIISAICFAVVLAVSLSTPTYQQESEITVSLPADPSWTCTELTQVAITPSSSFAGLMVFDADRRAAGLGTFTMVLGTTSPVYFPSSAACQSAAVEFVCSACTNGSFVIQQLLPASTPDLWQFAAPSTSVMNQQYNLNLAVNVSQPALASFAYASNYASWMPIPNQPSLGAFPIFTVQNISGPMYNVTKIAAGAAWSTVVQEKMTSQVQRLCQTQFCGAVVSPLCQPWVKNPPYSCTRTVTSYPTALAALGTALAYTTTILSALLLSFSLLYGRFVNRPSAPKTAPDAVESSQTAGGPDALRGPSQNKAEPTNASSGGEVYPASRGHHDEAGHPFSPSGVHVSVDH